MTFICKNQYSTRQLESKLNPFVKNAAKTSIDYIVPITDTKQSFVNYVINGFSNGVDTELVKLVGQSRGGEMYMVGGKTLKIDDNFMVMMSNYSAELKDHFDKSVIVTLRVQ